MIISRKRQPSSYKVYSYIFKIMIKYLICKTIIPLVKYKVEKNIKTKHRLIWMTLEKGIAVQSPLKVYFFIIIVVVVTPERHRLKLKKKN